MKMIIKEEDENGMADMVDERVRIPK